MFSNSVCSYCMWYRNLQGWFKLEIKTCRSVLTFLARRHVALFIDMNKCCKFYSGGYKRVGFSFL